MPRQSPINLSLAGNCHYRDLGFGNTSDTLVPQFVHHELTSGVSRRKPSGFINPTNYSLLHRSVTNAVGRSKAYHEVLPYGSEFTGTIGGGTGVSGRFNSSEHFDATLPETDIGDPQLANVALIRARNALKRTDINLGVAFGERNATARLVGDTASRLAKSYRHLRRGEVRNAMVALGISSARSEPRGSSAPKKWLELQYGWKPLLSDVYGACDALSKRNKSDWRVTAKGRARASGVKVYERTNTADCFRMTARWEQSAYCRIDALPQNEALISLSSLGITNPLLIGWELVPFSFVVDWFLPVGSWLEGLDALLGYEQFCYSNSLLTRSWWDGFGINAAPGNGYRVENSFMETKRVVRLDRTASSSVPFPHFPGFKDPRSLEHMANGLSLLATVFGRR